MVKFFCLARDERAVEHGLMLLSARERTSRCLHVAFCGVVLVWLLVPVAGLVSHVSDAAAQIVGAAGWWRALASGFVAGCAAAALATVLGTLAGVGLVSVAMPARGIVAGILVSPLVMPVVVVATGFFLLYGDAVSAQTGGALVLIHAALAAPFVVITVAASLWRFDTALLGAAASLGAGPWRRFRRIVAPQVGPGVAAGALLAFGFSFGGMAVAQLRVLEPPSATHGLAAVPAAAGVFVVVLAVLLAAAVEWLRRRGVARTTLMGNGE